MTEEGTPPEGGNTYTPPATQADLDRIVGDRLARERGKYADYDTLKDKASKFDDLDAASKTEMQKLQDAITDRDSKLADLPKQLRGQVIRFASAASAAGFIDPEDALMGIDGTDLSDAAAVKAALEDLASRKPHLVRQQDKGRRLPARPKPADGDPAGGDDDPTGGLKGKERAAAALRQFRNT